MRRFIFYLLNIENSSFLYFSSSDWRYFFCTEHRGCLGMIRVVWLCRHCFLIVLNLLKINIVHLWFLWLMLCERSKGSNFWVSSLRICFKFEFAFWISICHFLLIWTSAFNPLCKIQMFIFSKSVLKFSLIFLPVLETEPSNSRSTSSFCYY